MDLNLKGTKTSATLTLTPSEAYPQLPPNPLPISMVQKGRGFWRLNGVLLNYPCYVFGCNNILKKTKMSYSEQLIKSNSFLQPSDKELASVSPMISHSLLHDIILLEAKSYSMKFSAKLKTEALSKTEEINELIVNKTDYEDLNDIKIVKKLKEEFQEMEDEQDTTAAGNYLAKMQLEGKKP